MTATIQGQRGAGNCQVAFSHGHTQPAFRHALLVERYTQNDHVASLPEFLDGLRESLGASLGDLIAEHQGVKLWLVLDVQYRHMFEERIAVVHLTTHSLPSQRPPDRPGARPIGGGGAVSHHKFPAAREPLYWTT